MLQSLRNRRNRKGFTLAELLIVVAIIAVLVAIAVPLFVGSLNKAQQARDDANIRAVRGAAVVYLLENSGDETLWSEDAKEHGWDVKAEITSKGDIKSVEVTPLSQETKITESTCKTSTDTANNAGGFTVTLHIENTDIKSISTTGTGA